MDILVESQTDDCRADITQRFMQFSQHIKRMYHFVDGGLRSFFFRVSDDRFFLIEIHQIFIFSLITNIVTRQVVISVSIHKKKFNKNIFVGQLDVIFTFM